jgi:hypothetical protein
MLTVSVYLSLSYTYNFTIDPHSSHFVRLLFLFQTGGRWILLGDAYRSAARSCWGPASPAGDSGVG